MGSYFSELMQQNEQSERACHDNCGTLNSAKGVGSYVSGLMQENEVGPNKGNGRGMISLIN